MLKGRHHVVLAGGGGITKGCQGHCRLVPYGGHGTPAPALFLWPLGDLEECFSSCDAMPGPKFKAWPLGHGLDSTAMNQSTVFSLYAISRILLQ